jgi:phosphatidylinositol dimannoside acyltransferase
LLPVTLWYPDRRRWGLRIHDQIQVPTEGDRDAKIRAMTQAVAYEFQAAIKAHPQDWHMLQRVWTADLDPARAPAG